MYLFCVSTLLFIVFCELNVFNSDAASVTTSSKRNGSTVVVTSRRGNKNSTIFISTRSEFDGEMKKQACKCVRFFNCDKDNYYEIPDKSQECPGSDDVCCKIETPVEWDANTNTDIDTDTSTNSNPDKTDETSPSSASCRCVQRSECQITWDEKHGVGSIDPKHSGDCEKDEICCPNEKLPYNSNPTVPPSSLPCGERRGVLDVRVTGNEDVTFTIFGEFPWMVSLWKTVPDSDDEFLCGATILSSNIVLTAAHCVHQKDISALKVRAGDYDIKAVTSEEKAGTQERSCSAVIIHPKFDSQALLNDLAIIVTAEPFSLEQHVFPICTSLFGSEFADPQTYNSSRCLATGWGRSSANSKEKLSATLKKVDLKIIPSDECQDKLRETRLKKYFSLDKSFLCAGGVEGLDTCTGDGGGPLFCPLHTNLYQYVQVGVTSWGVGCGQNIPGVYASLEANNDWLLKESEKYKVSPAARRN